MEIYNINGNIEKEVRVLALGEVGPIGIIKPMSQLPGEEMIMKISSSDEE